MKREKVAIGLPISFMKKGDFGYVSYSYTPLVYNENESKDVESLKLYRLLSKEATFFKFNSDKFVRVTKIGEGWTASDFKFVYPFDVALIPRALSSMNLSEYFDGMLPVDWEILDEMYSFSQDVDLSNYTYLELSALVFNYVGVVSFSKVKKEAEKVLEYIPNAIRKYLNNFDTDYLSIFQQEVLLDMREEFDAIPDNQVKTFVEEFYNLVVSNIKDYINERNGDLPVSATNLEDLSKEDLDKLVNQAIEAKDWKLVERIRVLLK